MNDLEAYNFCTQMIKILTEKLQTRGFDYDDAHGWFNRYGKKFDSDTLKKIEKMKSDFKQYIDFSKLLRKRLNTSRDE